MIGKNNPFNIRYQKQNHWKGQMGRTGSFINFSCRQYGIRAAAYLLTWSYRRIGIDTIDGIINRFAPSVENETQRYIVYVCNGSRIDRYKRLSTTLEYKMVLLAMSQFEGNPVILEEISECFRIFNLKIYGCPE